MKTPGGVVHSNLHRLEMPKRAQTSHHEGTKVWTRMHESLDTNTDKFEHERINFFSLVFENETYQLS